jgi:hypothetical protein
MQLSDILTVLSILVAVIALLSEDRREIIFRKFDTWNWAGILFIIIIIHIVLAFEWFLGNFPAWRYLLLIGSLRPACGHIFSPCVCSYIYLSR